MRSLEGPRRRCGGPLPPYRALALQIAGAGTDGSCRRHREPTESAPALRSGLRRGEKPAGDSDRLGGSAYSRERKRQKLGRLSVLVSV